MTCAVAAQEVHSSRHLTHTSLQLTQQQQQANRSCLFHFQLLPLLPLLARLKLQKQHNTQGGHRCPYGLLCSCRSTKACPPAAASPTSHVGRQPFAKQCNNCTAFRCLASP
jgi:hypothetical protein